MKNFEKKALASNDKIMLTCTVAWVDLLQTENKITTGSYPKYKVDPMSNLSLVSLIRVVKAEYRA